MKLHIIQIEASTEDLRVSRPLADAFTDMISHLCDVVTRTYEPTDIDEDEEDEEDENGDADTV